MDAGRHTRVLKYVGRIGFQGSDSLRPEGVRSALWRFSPAGHPWLVEKMMQDQTAQSKAAQDTLGYRTRSATVRCHGCLGGDAKRAVSAVLKTPGSAMCRAYAYVCL